MAGQKAHRKSFLHIDTTRYNIIDIKVLAVCFKKFLSSQIGRKLPSVKFHVFLHNVAKECCFVYYLEPVFKFLDDDLNYIPNWDLL
jgi:hypothetical protein